MEGEEEYLKLLGREQEISATLRVIRAEKRRLEQNFSIALSTSNTREYKFQENNCGVSCVRLVTVNQIPKAFPEDVVRGVLQRYFENRGVSASDAANMCMDIVQKMRSMSQKGPHEKLKFFSRKPNAYKEVLQCIVRDIG